MDNCICYNPVETLENEHFMKYNVELMLLTDSEGTAIVIMKNGLAIAVFDINFCPICGRELNNG